MFMNYSYFYLFYSILSFTVLVNHYTIIPCSYFFAYELHQTNDFILQ